VKTKEGAPSGLHHNRFEEQIKSPHFIQVQWIFHMKIHKAKDYADISIGIVGQMEEMGWFNMPASAWFEHLSLIQVSHSLFWWGMT
jgi:hypothetical protein